MFDIEEDIDDELEEEKDARSATIRINVCNI